MTLLPPAATIRAETTHAVARLFGAWASRAADSPALQRRRDRWLTALVGALALAAYVRSLLPGTGYSGDVAKWQYLSVVGGVPHATGYPLFTALIQAWSSLVPLGSPAWRVNFLSAVLGAAAIAVLFQLLRTLGIRRTVAAATALTFAVTPTFWAQASVAEVYTLHILFMGLVALCLARWRLGASNSWLLVGMAIYALSFGHHMMSILALPGIAWLLWSDRRRAFTLRNALWCASFVVLSASQYLYTIYMTKVGGYVEVPVHNLADIVSLVRGDQFSDEMLSPGLYRYFESQVPMLGKVVGAEYVLLQAPIAYGIWWGLRRPGAFRNISVQLLLLGVCSTIFATTYNVFDIEVFFLPLLFVLAVFLGMGLEGIAGWSELRYPRHAPVALGIAVLLVAIPLVTGLLDYRRASQRGNLGDADRMEQVLAAVGDGALLVTENYADAEYLSYYLYGEGEAAKRNIEIAGARTPHAADDEYLTAEDVVRYFQGQRNAVARAAERIEGEGPPPLFTPTESMAEDLEDHGYKVTAVLEELWRIQPPDEPSSNLPPKVHP